MNKNYYKKIKNRFPAIDNIVDFTRKNFHVKADPEFSVKRADENLLRREGRIYISDKIAAGSFFLAGPERDECEGEVDLANTWEVIPYSYVNNTKRTLNQRNCCIADHLADHFTSGVIYEVKMVKWFNYPKNVDKLRVIIYKPFQNMEDCINNIFYFNLNYKSILDELREIRNGDRI